MNTIVIDYTAMYFIKDYALKLAELITLHREIKKTDMPKGDKEFAIFISKGIEVRPAWITNLRSNRAMTYNRVHATFTATNKLIESLGGTEMPTTSILKDEKATVEARDKKTKKQAIPQ
jgi:hypothetical protein